MVVVLVVTIGSQAENLLVTVFGPETGLVRVNWGFLVHL